MLAGLRHHRFVSGDVQHDQIHAADACQHVADEALMARDVNERQGDALLERVREPQIDGDAARLFLLEPIGVGAGQREHERALAVVDVSGRSDNDVFDHGST
jgi:hypothetical protein